MLRMVLLLVGVAVLGVLLWRLGPPRFSNYLAGRVFGPRPVAVRRSPCTRAFALRACVLRPGLLGYPDALALRLSGEAIQSLTLTGPLLAEPTRAWLLKREGLSLQEGFAVTITECLIASFVTAAMSIAGLVYLVQHFEPAAVVAGIAIGVVGAFSAFLVASAIAIARRFYFIGRIIGALAHIGVPPRAAPTRSDLDQPNGGSASDHRARSSRSFVRPYPDRNRRPGAPGGGALLVVESA